MHIHPQANASGAFHAGLDGVNANAQADAFAGAKAQGQASFRNKYFDAQAHGYASAGIGANAGGNLSIKDGRLRIGGNLGVSKIS
jgi:hypothetical protein